MSVPDQYAGKRVRCPGCQAPQRVPLATPAPEQEAGLAVEPSLDFSALDATDGGSGVRRLRQIMIGCGACSKTIRVPESKLGGTMPCPQCGALLRVDPFNLSKAKGDLIDMTHLELDKADPLLDGGSHGSTIGGSSIQLDNSGMGTGHGTARPASGSMSGVTYTDSQTQMNELRELNDLRHSGQISNDEYRQRKAEIYAGKTLAIQAMSRSAHGDGNRPVLKADDRSPLLPKPVLALLAVLVLGGVGFAAYSMLGGSAGSGSSPANPTTTPGPVAAAPPEAGDPVEPIEPTPGDETASLVGGGQDHASADEPPAPAEADEEPQVATADPVRTYPVTYFEAPVAPKAGGIGVAAAPDAPAVVMRITDWPVEWPAYRIPEDDPEAIGRACEQVKRMSLRNDSALIGVGVGPPATGLDDPAYQTFRAQQESILTEAAAADRVMDDLNFQSSERTATLGALDCHRLHVTSRSDRNVRATILTGVQDGYCLTYWFTGSKSLYPRFLDTVGVAEFGPATASTRR